jgi:hypothetical protein
MRSFPHSVLEEWVKSIAPETRGSISVEAFQTAFTQHAQEIMADVPNYTNLQPIIQVSEVKE